MTRQALIVVISVCHMMNVESVRISINKVSSNPLLTPRCINTGGLVKNADTYVKKENVQESCFHNTYANCSK